MIEAKNDTNATHYLRKIRKEAPRIHCLTNSVVQNQTANMLLSVGAHPSMSADIDEVGDFTASAKALLVNLGTLDSLRKGAIATAIETANNHDIPWILDPVLVNRAPKRLAFAKSLVEQKPMVIRGNEAEIDVFSLTPETLASQSGAIVVVTGQEDLITDGQQTISISGGHSLMSHVTGMGCSGTAVLTAFIAVASNYLEATKAALVTFGETGQIVGEKATGPSSFETSFIDHLYQTSIKASLS